MTAAHLPHIKERLEKGYQAVRETSYEEATRAAAESLANRRTDPQDVPFQAKSAASTAAFQRKLMEAQAAASAGAVEKVHSGLELPPDFDRRVLATTIHTHCAWLVPRLVMWGPEPTSDDEARDISIVASAFGTHANDVLLNVLDVLTPGQVTTAERTSSTGSRPRYWDAIEDSLVGYNSIDLSSIMVGNRATDMASICSSFLNDVVCGNDDMGSLLSGEGGGSKVGVGYLCCGDGQLGSAVAGAVLLSILHHPMIRPPLKSATMVGRIYATRANTEGVEINLVRAGGGGGSASQGMQWCGVAHGFLSSIAIKPFLKDAAEAAYRDSVPQSKATGPASRLQIIRQSRGSIDTSSLSDASPAQLFDQFRSVLPCCIPPTHISQIATDFLLDARSASKSPSPPTANAAEAQGVGTTNDDYQDEKDTRQDMGSLSTSISTRDDLQTPVLTTRSGESSGTPHKHHLPSNIVPDFHFGAAPTQSQHAHNNSNVAPTTALQQQSDPPAAGGRSVSRRGTESGGGAQHFNLFGGGGDDDRFAHSRKNNNVVSHVGLGRVGELSASAIARHADPSATASRNNSLSASTTSRSAHTSNAPTPAGTEAQLRRKSHMSSSIVFGVEPDEVPLARTASDRNRRCSHSSGDMQYNPQQAAAMEAFPQRDMALRGSATAESDGSPWPTHYTHPAVAPSHASPPPTRGPRPESAGPTPTAESTRKHTHHHHQHEVPVPLPRPFNPNADEQRIRGPTSRTNWVIPGLVLCGPMPDVPHDLFETTEALDSSVQFGRRGNAIRQPRRPLIKELANLGVNTVVSLIASGGIAREMVQAYSRLCEMNGSEGVVHHIHVGMEDGAPLVPSVRPIFFEAVMEAANIIRAQCDSGQPTGCMYIHCLGGHGRTGMFVSALLAELYPLELGTSGMKAVNYCDKLHSARQDTEGRSSPETQEQRLSTMSFIDSIRKQRNSST